MAAPKKHLKIEGFQRPELYKYPKRVVASFPQKERNRQQHGAFLKNKLKDIRRRFNLSKDQKLPHKGLLQDDVIYVQFISPWGYEIRFESLVDNSAKPKYQLLNIQQESRQEQDGIVTRFIALVMLKEGGVSHFMKKVEEYLNPEKDSGIKKNPKNAPLLENIDDLKIATLKAFWTDGITHEFPNQNDVVWWEVWLRKSAYDFDKIRTQIQLVKAELSSQKLTFREHVIHLVKASAVQLSNSLMLLDCISELRKPQTLNDFITHPDITYQDEKEWAEDLLSRTHFQLSEDRDPILVSILDSGINNIHPLLAPAIPDTHLEAWKPSWGVADTEPNGGHGTGMAGLVLFGDLTEALASSDQITVYHGVESFKVYHPSEKTDPQLYGLIYQDGHNALIAERPFKKRVYCLAVTNDGIIKSGRPSSSSTALDRLIFGNADQDDTLLVVVSGGNVMLSKAEDFPDMNYIHSIQDPGQAYNAITVGACTFLDLTKDAYEAVAKRGAMSPFNPTSASWETQWPNKPDLVFEAGNRVVDPVGEGLITHEQLSPVSLDKDFNKRLFTPFNGTSAAAALVSKMAAELRTWYPHFWPETIRGLLVHSADWTEAMLDGRSFQQSKEPERRAILRSVGYGVPNINKAMHSANNALTLIAEEYIYPYRKEGAATKYNEYHLYELPWPKDVLLHEVGAVGTRLTVTLSYFIEPNPNGKEYAKAFSYHSHALDFKMIKSGESIEEFKRRVSAFTDAEENEDIESPDLSAEGWTIRERVGSKGSLRKDFLDATGAALYDRNVIAVYPKSGWYKTRKREGKHNQKVRYSLLISIETAAQEIDLYTTVENIVLNKISISNETGL